MCSVLQHKMDELKEGLRQRDELIEVSAAGVRHLTLKNALTGMRLGVLWGSGPKCQSSLVPPCLIVP